MSELAKRVLVSVVAAPLAILAAYAGRAALAALLGIVAAVGTWELFRIARARGVRPLVAGIPLAAAIPLLVQAHVEGVLRVAPGVALTGAVVLALALLAASIWARGVDGMPLAATAVTLFGVVYIGAALSFAYALRYHRYTLDAAAGTALLGLPLVLTWASDIGGYVAGRAVGRHRLIPGVSPAKTVEGAVGGLALTVLVTWGYVALVLRPHAQLALSSAGIIFFGLAVSVAAQIGDLAESLLKREAGVKDSSRVIPGHGGVLDRVDSLLFVLPVAYLLLDQFGLLIPAPR